jgi:pimeloyl-ACP methyl ester carboxylesterase
MTLTTARDGFVELNGLRLHYLDHGSAGKPPLLLLHGMAMHAHTFDDNALAWNDAFHVVALEQHGHGDSDHPSRADDGSGAPSDAGAYRTHTLAREVLAFADAMDWSRFSIVGQSMGGHNGMYLAATVPERIDRLVISDMEPMFRLELMAFLRDAMALPTFDSVDAAAEAARARSPRASFEQLKQRSAQALRRLADGRLTMKYDLWAPKRWEPLDLWSLLERISCPTLLMRGVDSPVLRQDVAEDMVRRMPNSRLVVVPQAGHGIGLDNPAVFQRAIRDFLLEEPPST